MATNESPYTILGINKTASRKEINTAFKRASLKAHPNKPGGSKNAFQKLGQAYNAAIKILESGNASMPSQTPIVKLLEDEVLALTDKENEIDDAAGKTHWKEWITFYKTYLGSVISDQNFLQMFQQLNYKSTEILRSVKTLYSSPVSAEVKEKVYQSLLIAWNKNENTSDEYILQKINESEKQQSHNNFNRKHAMLIRMLRDNKELLQKEKTELYNEYIKSDEYLGIVTEQQIKTQIEAKKAAITQALTPKPRRNNTSGVPYLRAYNITSPLDERATILEKENNDYTTKKAELDEINNASNIKLPLGYYLPYDIQKTHVENYSDWVDFNNFMRGPLKLRLILTTLCFKITSEHNLIPIQPPQPDKLYKMYIGRHGGARRDAYSNINFYKDEPYFTTYVINGLPKLIDAIAAVTNESRADIIRKLQENNPGLQPLYEPIKQPAQPTQTNNINNAFGGSRKTRRGRRDNRSSRRKN
jgi:hypothetical protein